VRTLSIVAVTGIVAVLAACQQAPVSTPITEPEREPHPIEGMWQAVGVTTRTAGGTTRTFDLRGVSVPLTFEFTDGTFESRGTLTSPTESEAGSQSGTYVVAEETRTIVITAQANEPDSQPWTRLYSYGMIDDDKLDLVDHDPVGGASGSSITYHLERMDSN